MENIVKIWSDADYINIRISHNDLIELAEKHPTDPVKVVNVSAFLKEFLHELQEYQLGYERDGNAIEEVIEECIQKVAEGGSDSVELIEID